MRIDCRERDCWGWDIFDKNNGNKITGLHIIAVDDSIGQIIRYESTDNGEILFTWPLISEIRNIELVYTDWIK